MDGCGSSGRMRYDVRILVFFRYYHGTEQKAGQRFFTHFSDKDVHQVEGVCTGSGGNSGFFITLLSIWGSYFERVGRRLFIHDYATDIFEKPENRMVIHETDGCGRSGIRGNWDGRGRYISPVRNVQRVSSYEQSRSWAAFSGRPLL